MMEEYDFQDELSSNDTFDDAIEQKEKDGEEIIEFNTNHIVQKLASLLIFVAGVVLFTITTILLYTGKDAVKEHACKLVTTGQQYSLFDINTCVRQPCTFDTSACINPCPFGFHMDENGCPNSCACGQSGVFEGDIQFDYTFLPQLSNLYANKDAEGTLANRKWLKDGTGRIHIPFYFDYDDEQLQSVVFDISKTISDLTCVDLRSITKEEIEKYTTYIEFTKGPDKLSCGTSIGYSPPPDDKTKWPQNIYISKYCISFAVVSHLIFHKLGLLHEHSRLDRDSYITILWKNILREKHFNFYKRSAEERHDSLYEYDVNSIMHYPDTAFAIGGRKTITKHDGSSLSQVAAPSPTDYAKLYSFYKCDNNKHRSGVWTDWAAYAPCSKDCGTGLSKAWRKCLDPNRNYAFNCKGAAYKRKSCNTQDCSGKFQSWTIWSQCSHTCGKYGLMRRHRHCSESHQCGKQLNDFYQSKSCNYFECSTGENVDSESKWTIWGKWSLCVDDSNAQVQRRERLCILTGRGKSADCEVDISDKSKSFEQSGINKGKQIHTVNCRQNQRHFSDSITRDLVVASRAFSPQFAEKITSFPASEKDYFSSNVATITQTPCGEFKSKVSWYFADFTGDLINDVLCVDVNGKYEIVKSSSAGELTTATKGTVSMCKDKYFGDFNGDGKYDLLCRNDGQLSFFLMASDGFTTGPVSVGEFCVGENDVIVLLVSNGDKKHDIGCIYKNNRFGIRENNYH